MLLICQFATQVACGLKIVRIQTDGIQVEDVRENLQGSAARLFFAWPNQFRINVHYVCDWPEMLLLNLATSYVQRIRV